MSLFAGGCLANGGLVLWPVRTCRVLHIPAARTGSKSFAVPSLGLAPRTTARRSLHLVASKPSESGNSGPPQFGGPVSNHGQACVHPAAVAC